MFQNPCCFKLLQSPWRLLHSTTHHALTEKPNGIRKLQRRGNPLYYELYPIPTFSARHLKLILVWWFILCLYDHIIMSALSYTLYPSICSNHVHYHWLNFSISRSLGYIKPCYNYIQVDGTFSQRYNYVNTSSKNIHV